MTDSLMNHGSSRDALTIESRLVCPSPRVGADPDPICCWSTDDVDSESSVFDDSDLTTERLSGTSENEAAGCPDCEQLRRHLADAEEHLTEMAQRVAGLELQLRRAGSAEVALRRELEQRAETGPKSLEIREVLDAWQASHPKAKTPMSGPRAKLVRTALGWGYSVDDLKLAVEGLARFPFAGPAGRQATPGPGAKRFDDLSHALSNEERIERCMALAKGEITPAEPTPKPVPVSPRPASYDPIDEILPRLEAVKTAGQDQWSARCPAHDDRHASLSIGRGRKGALVHCHTGCTVQQIADALRLPLTDLFAQEIPTAPARPRLEIVGEPLPTDDQIAGWAQRLLNTPKLLVRLREVKGWEADTLARLGLGWDGERIVIPVRDHAGQLTTIARYLPGGKPKMLGLKNRPRGLFPAPEIVPAAEPVWVVEGEPDAVTGHQLGIHAIGVPGANGWRDDMAPRLAVRDVVICMDCDREGRGAAQRVEKSLASVAKTVTVVDLDHNRDDHYDLTDFANDGGTKDLLHALVDDANARRAAA